jgi:hypothetical protein
LALHWDQREALDREAQQAEWRPALELPEGREKAVAVAADLGDLVGLEGRI